MKGAGEIGFTIVSISFSLVAVFIPLLLMGGIVGRLFREFAMTVTIAVLVSAFVSPDADADDVLALPAARCRRHGCVYRVIEAFFNGLIALLPAHAGYRAAVPVHHAAGVPGHGQPTVYLYIIIPKGFFPPQDNGVVLGITEAAQDISFKEMMTRAAAALADIVAQDPDVGGLCRPRWAAGFGGQTEQQRAAVHRAEAAGSARRRHRCRIIINRLRPKIAKVQGGKLFLQPVQDIRVGARLAKTEYQYTLQDADLAELYQWAPKILDKLQSLPMLRDVTSDQQDGGTTATLVIDRDAAARFGIQPQVIDDTLYDAFGQRQITQYFSQVNSYHLILEVPPDMAGEPATLNKLYVQVADRSGGAAVHLRAMEHDAGAAAVDQPSEPVPGGDDLLQPGAGRGARRGGGCDATPRCGRWACR